MATAERAGKAGDVTGSRTLKRREFMDAVRDACTAALPEDRRQFRSRRTMNLLKVHFNANYRIHYEVMIVAERQLIELGLHFEDGPESTARLLEHFDRAVIEIKHALGQDVELERWTKSWGHLFEVRALEPLTPGHAQALGERLAEMIGVLQPLLDEAFEVGLAPVEPRPATGRPRFRSRN
jgi:hypothetical protein